MSLALYRPHAILHPAPSPVSAPALAAGPEQPHLPGTPSGTKTQRAPGRADLGCCPSTGNAEPQCHQPHKLQGSVAPRMGSSWDASHGPRQAPLPGDISADQQPLQRGQSVQRASGRPALHSITQIKKCCSLRGVLERSALQHLLSTPTLHGGERSTSQARPHPGITANGICSPQRTTPPKKHRHPFLERWLPNMPPLSSSTTATSPS